MTVTAKSTIEKMYSTVKKPKYEKELFRLYDLGNNFNFNDDLNFK